MNRIFIFLACLLTAGCSSTVTKQGFYQSALRENAKDIKDEDLQISDEEIAKAFKKKAQLPKNFRLAVYFEPSSTDSWRWTSEDKIQILTTLQNSQKQGYEATIFPMLESLVEGNDKLSLRLAAARHGADALLIIKGRGESQKGLRDWALTYALVFPTLFVKGNETETLFIASASLWDVRNNYLYLSAESEGLYKEKHALFFPESDREIFKKSKDRAIDQLKQNLLAMVNGKSQEPSTQ